MLLQVLDAGTFSEDDTEKFLNTVDANNDGKIQFEEFLDWVMEGQGSEAAKVRQLAELQFHS